MKLKHELNAILLALQGLYSKVSLAILRRRIKSVRIDGGADRGREIKGPLFDRIEALARTEGAKSPVKARAEAGQKHEPAAGSLTRHRKGSEKSPAVVSRALSGVSRYFKHSHSASISQPHLREKLEKSIWDHVHTALRLARQGKVRTAHLHAEIANSALKEVAHHMSDEDYVALKSAVDEKIAAISGT